jgi:predicted nuclease with TOPRIM domain
MSDADFTLRILREIQSRLADMRDDRTVLISILDRQDSGLEGLSAELRSLRSQFDSLRNEMREFRNEMHDHLSAINERHSRIEDRPVIKADPT